MRNRQAAIFSSRRPIWGLTIGLVALLGAAPDAAAQRFKKIDPKPGVKGLAANVAGTMRNAAGFQAGKADVDKYFKQYYFPMMTQEDPENLGQLAKRRDYLINTYLRRAAVPAAQEHLTALTLGVMQVLARQNFHPAVRYNAVMTIGMLDKQYPTNVTAPVPLPAATNSLLELVEQSEFDGVPVPPSIQVGALIGLERHARFGVDPQHADRVTKAALTVVEQPQAPKDMAKDVHHWMKVAAARVLARQHAKGPTAEVQAALNTLVVDGKMKLADRCAVADLMGKIEYQAAAGIDGDAAVLALGTLTKAVVDDEAELARDFQQEKLQGNRGFSRRTRSRFSGTDQGPKFGRSRLLSRVSAIARGAKALRAGVPEEAKQRLNGLIAGLAPVETVASKKNSVDLEITEAVIKLEAAVANMIESWQPGDQAPAEPAEDEFAESK